MTANVKVPITTDPAPPPPTTFAAPDLLAPVPDNVKSVTPSPVFSIRSRHRRRPGARRAPSWTSSGGSPPETLPRIGPRLPTMARFPTLVAVGTGPATAPLAQRAVVSGGQLARETRSADHARGRSVAAGPDVEAAGVHVDSAAAFDVARIALRRAAAAADGRWHERLDPVHGLGWVARRSPRRMPRPPAGRRARPPQQCCEP